MNTTVVTTASTVVESTATGSTVVGSTAGRLRRALSALRREERAEGVISTAIAVLIVAFLGVGAFAAFRVVLDTTQTRAVDCVQQIGANGTSSC